MLAKHIIPTRFYLHTIIVRYLELGEVCDLVRGITYGKNDEVQENGLRVLRANNINLDNSLNFEDIKQISKSVSLSEDKKLKKDDIFICLASGSKSHIGKVAFVENDTDYYFGGFMGVVRTNQDNKAISQYIFQQLKSSKFNNYLRKEISGVNINNLNSKILSNYKIPLPPLEVQEQIVAEIEQYQKVIDGAKQVVENWKPNFRIDPSWEMAELGEVFSLSSGRFLPKSNQKNGDHFVYGGNGILGQHDEYFVEKPTLIIGRVGAYCGVVHITEPKSWITDNALYINEFKKDADINFLKLCLDSINLNSYAKTGGQPSISQSTIKELKIPLPPLEVQEQIVAEIEVEQKVVNANKELIKKSRRRWRRRLVRFGVMRFSL